jgi:hypothetical protein
MSEKSCPRLMEHPFLEDVWVILPPEGYTLMLDEHRVVLIKNKPRPTEGEKPIERMHAIQDIKERLSR